MYFFDAENLPASLVWFNFHLLSDLMVLGNFSSIKSYQEFFTYFMYFKQEYNFQNE